MEATAEITLQDIKSDIRLFESRIHHLKKRGSGWRGFCPFHNDHKTPNLRIDYKDGALLWTCDPCGIGGSIIDLEMRLAECDSGTAIQRLVKDVSERKLPAAKVAAPKLAERVKTGLSITKEQVQQYARNLEEQDPIFTEAGSFLGKSGLEDIATNLQLGFKPRQYFGCGDRCEQCGQYPALTIPLYWQGELVGLKYRNLKAQDKSHKWTQEKGSKADFLWLADLPPVNPESPVVGIFEGVRDVALARALGFNAIGPLSTSAVPESNGSERFAESLNLVRKLYRHAALIGDFDEEGKAAMRRVHDHLGTGAIFTHLFPGFKDLSSFYESKGEEATRKVLQDCCEAVMECQAFAGAPSKTPLPDEVVIMTENFADVKAKPIKWLWENRIPRGKLVIFSGNPDVGKSTVAFDIVARYTTGRQWPDGAENQSKPGRVLMMLAEDDAADTAKPRLEAAGAEVSRVERIIGVVVAAKTGREQRAVALDRDLVAIEKVLENNPQIGLVVIDPLSSYLGKSDMNKEQEVRRVLGPIKELCERTGVTVIGIGHFNKRSDVRALHRVGGAVAMTGVARAVWLFMKNTTDEDEYLMVLAKNNLTRKRTGLKYRFTSKELSVGSQPVIDWQGECAESADSILQAAESPEESKVAKAKHFLKDTLAKAPRLAAELYSEAEEQGIGSTTLKNAKSELGVSTKKEGGRWVWFLPVKAPQEEAKEALF